MGRTPLTEDQVRARVLDYCGRYGVSPGPEGLPPFPTGRRETRQHREWLTVYRALQRARARAAAAAPSDGSTRCPICALAMRPDEAVPLVRAGRRTVPVHQDCADLARKADEAGPDTLARLGHLLWPRAGRHGS